MNILTFDIEDWYNCDFISQDFNWDKYEVRLYEGVDRILQELDKRGLKGTFFCLGWIAEKHPEVIRRIDRQGHHIGCHSYQHELVFRMDAAGFREDTHKSKQLLEDLISREVDAYRAPGFSITQHNTWAFEVLGELGFRYDCSIFPSHHDYGGFPDFGKVEPVLLQLNNGMLLKEFPINIHRLLGKDTVFTGGGFFRLFPYSLIRRWSRDAEYLMTYFHTRDFDPDQPVLTYLPPVRKFKSYVGLKGAFAKFRKYLDDVDFCTVQQADKVIEWDSKRIVQFANNQRDF